ncbi:hypothetical protein ACWCO3_28410 [Micromonospora sp. NPDC002411]
MDMERYSRRSNLQQYEAQRHFRELLHEAAGAVGLDRVAWTTQQAGDGELAIVPREVSESREGTVTPAVASTATPATPAAVRRNARRPDESRSSRRRGVFSAARTIGSFTAMCSSTPPASSQATA